MTFPGESIRLEGANAITGGLPDYGASFQYRAGSATVSAGTSFVAGFYNWFHADEATDVVASVVLVLGAATSGTVRVSYGVDPDFAYDDAADATQDLGTHAVSGESTLVLPVSSFDLAALVNYDHAQVAYVEVLSGSIELVQMKFRIWPPEGISGAWVAGPTSTVERTRDTVATDSSIAQYESTVSMSDALSGAQAAWDSAVGLPVISGGSAGAAPRVRFNDNSTTDDQYYVRLDLNLLHVQARGWGQVIESSASGQYAHPDEVRGDLGAVTRDADGNPITYEFVSWSGGIEAEQYVGRTSTGVLLAPSVANVVSMEADTPPPLQYTVGSLDYIAQPSGGPAGTAMPLPTTDDTDPLVTVLSLPSSPEVLITVAGFSWYGQPIENPVVDGSGDIQYESSAQITVTIPADLTATLAIPDHFIWDPDAVEEIPLRIRQRGDGLGMGGPRVRGIGSRQRSVRVRGYV